MTNFHLKIISPKRILFEEDATEITVPTKAGEITILAKHEPMVSQLSMGGLIIKDGKKEHVVAVYGGFIHIEKDGNVIVLADSAQHIYEIDEELTKEAIKKAEIAITKARKSRESFATSEGDLLHSLSHEDHKILAETQAELLMNFTRLKIIRKHRSHHGARYDNQ
ncbi:MAG: ATP synthase F1 subunit epsilon [Candidatus Saccharibacteria bacterium]|jgi:F-type H+-transporting ATPase subunit epsilon